MRMVIGRMSFFNRASPAVAEILKKFDRSEKPIDIDHEIHESGSVRYHMQASATNPQIAYMSISTRPLSPETSESNGLPESILQDIRRVYTDYAEIVEPPRNGFLLTLRLNFARISFRKEDRGKAIAEISSLQALLMTLQLKDMIWNLGSQDKTFGMYQPIKLVYHPRDPFFVIRLPEKITTIFPMRFKENSDVILATSFFQELMDVGISPACAKAPCCTWSPIPPPELRGEAFQHLTTNGGFVSFDILPRHVKGARADKTIWILLNFDAYVKYHVKCTKGFIQRKMRQRMDSLVEMVQNARIGRTEDSKNLQSSKSVKKKTLMRLSKSTELKRKFRTAISNQIKRFHSRIRIKGLDRFRRRWFKIPKFNSLRKNTKLE